MQLGPGLVEGRFLTRLNRFAALVEVDGEQVAAGVGVGAAVGAGTRLGTDRSVPTGVGSTVSAALLVGDSILVIVGLGLTISCPTHAIRKIPAAAKAQ
ncbi:MAG TPA: hypothetical protein EYO17_00780 [Dehalococcoidia bacterium]|nr:hypothetical protein [Dehalococcoidia bacterium]